MITKNNNFIVTWIKQFLLVVMALLWSGMVNIANAHVDGDPYAKVPDSFSWIRDAGGMKIIETNCDYANLGNYEGLDDDTRKKHGYFVKVEKGNEFSCEYKRDEARRLDSENQDAFTMEDFKVRISYMTGWDHIEKLFGDSDASTAWLGIDDIHTSPGVAGSFVSRLQGDRLCVYYKPIGIFQVAVDKEGVVSRNISGTGTPSNCFTVPYTPPPYVAPDWGNFISPICTTYGGSSLAAHSRSPFLGVIVQCMEDTMLNLFFFEGVNGESFFKQMQAQLKDFVMALLALYIALLGYKFIITPGAIKQAEWHWIGLKIALVLYFAVGPGMTQLLPGLIDISKELSMYAMESTLGGDQAAYEQLRTQLIAKGEEKQEAREELLAARAAFRVVMGLPSDNQDYIDAMNEQNAAYNNFNVIKADYMALQGQFAGWGYDYCNFKSLADDGAYVITDPFTGQQRDKSFLRVFDIVDCKLAKYLGISDVYGTNGSIPKTLLIGLLSFFTVVGIPIFFFSMIFFVMVVLISIRVVHIYIMAIFGLILLAFFAPLFVPAVLFQFTKEIFDRWFKNIMAYTLQPVFLFTFLAITFFTFDLIIFEENHFFYPICQEDDVADCKKYPFAEGLEENMIMMEDTGNDVTFGMFGLSENNNTPTGFGSVTAGDIDVALGNLTGTSETYDRYQCIGGNDTLGCIYQNLIVSGNESKTGDGGLGPNFQFGQILTGDKADLILMGLLKLILMSFVAQIVMGFTEEMATRMVDAAGGGASAMSSAPPPNINQAINFSAKSMGALFKAEGKIAKYAIKRKIGRNKLGNDMLSQNAAAAEMDLFDQIDKGMDQAEEKMGNAKDKIMGEGKESKASERGEGQPAAGNGEEGKAS